MKQMKKLALAVIMICFCITNAIADDRISEERSIGDFTGIAVSTGIRVHLLQGKALTLKVEAKNEEILERVITEIKGGTLYVSLKANFNTGFKIRNIGNVDVYVAADNLEKLSTSSGSSAKTLTALQTNSIKIDCSSGSSVSLDIKANNIDCDISSGSSCRLEGTAQDLKVDAGSGSNGNYENLNVETASVSVSSGASLKINVSKELNASVSSGGVLKYSGNPEVKSNKSSSGGQITKM